ncbi:MAG: HAD family phosphatase [bacterium]|nr:HAD family phosphatase [bacterium]
MTQHTIIFDLGNVILPFDPVKPCRVLSEMCGKSEDTVCDLIYRNNLERKFEEGTIDGRQFTEAVSRVLGIPLEHDWFRDLWSDMFTENTETTALIHRLAPSHELMILSNTNRWHWEFARENFQIVTEIDNAVVSYEVGVLKPHPKIYEAALAKSDPSLPAVFIDDIKANAEAANDHGITGIRFISAEQVENALEARDCL